MVIEKKTLSTSQSFGENDIIECYFRRKTISRRNYTLICFKKNGKIIGQETLNGKDEVWPVIELGSCEAEIQADVGIQDETLDNKFGNGHVLLQYL